jgi:hypothetical protein
MDTKEEDLEFRGREDGRLIEDQWAKLPNTHTRGVHHFFSQPFQP